jgi:D-glycero-D-manno-heptose 1,7-bisphosphate phosphatase
LSNGATTSHDIEDTKRPRSGRSARAGGRTAVFLDRDGVINDQTTFVNVPDDLRLLPGAASAIRRLNEAGLPVVVVTNQGGIALGYLTEDDLAAIHERMANLLAAEGAHVDAIYYCPHYPTGTIPEYTKESPDRKPGTGMLERARDELGINLKKSVLIGDSLTDILAGNRAGCITILVESGRTHSDMTTDDDDPDADAELAAPDFVRQNLWEAVDLLFEALTPYHATLDTEDPREFP